MGSTGMHEVLGLTHENLHGLDLIKDQTGEEHRVFVHPR